MLLKSLKLHNIRSYIDQEIAFPQGSLLLSGDIGSGKSTILLAIEFALFGLLRGELSGSALLRNGAEKGSVELAFELNGENISICRTLHRSKGAIEQDAGYIIRNEMRKDATAQELKTEILALIGYPKDLVTKSKSLIYRYTVYTPQEAMKQIILDDKESRLDILRKVFDIDKYKRIKENATTYARTMRETQREYAGMIFDLEEKKRMKLAREKEIQAIVDEISTILPELDDAREKTTEKKSAIAQTEQKIKDFNDKKRMLGVAEAQLRMKTEQNTSNAAELARMKEQIEQLKKELAEKKELDTDFSNKIKELGDEITSLERTISDVNSKTAEFRTKMQMSSETKNKITQISQCPLCLQAVTDEHKHSINEKEDAKIKEMQEHLANHQKQSEESQKKKQELLKEREELREKEKQAALLKLKKELLFEREKSQKIREDDQEKIKHEINRISEIKTKLYEELKMLVQIEQEFMQKKKEFDDAVQKERNIEILYNKICEKKEGIEAIAAQLAQDVNRKEGIKKKLEELQRLHQWLTDFFVKTIELIEVQVMTRVYHEFNELFQSWFNVLVEDETIQARLDDSFTPIVQQNGYDIEIENLSGGEKTACALAYRLALNKVINDLITSVQTKDILILDEPTDGFSSEQLDKIRDVLEQLGSKQVIIVSHEQKIENYVENVMHIQKSEHISRVIC